MASKVIGDFDSLTPGVRPGMSFLKKYLQVAKSGPIGQIFFSFPYLMSYDLNF